MSRTLLTGIPKSTTLQPTDRKGCIYENAAGLYFHRHRIGATAGCLADYPTPESGMATLTEGLLVLRISIVR